MRCLVAVVTIADRAVVSKAFPDVTPEALGYGRLGLPSTHWAYFLELADKKAEKKLEGIKCSMMLVGYPTRQNIFPTWDRVFDCTHLRPSQKDVK